MSRRLLTFACFSSTGLLAVSMVLILFEAGVPNSWEHRISLGRQFHVGVGRFSGDSVGRIVVFNDLTYGPYRGSLIALDDYPPLDREVAWDSYGIYYRYFRWFDGVVLWTLMFSLWYPLLLFAVLPCWWVLHRYRGRSPATDKSATVGVTAKQQ